LQNRQGKTRLSRWYVSYNDDERKKIEAESHRIVVGRDNKMASFLEVSAAGAPTKTPLCVTAVQES